MREIEIKARVKNKNHVLKLISQENINLSLPIKQHDVVYAVPGVKDNAPGSVWLRLRTENDQKTIFTLKKQHRGSLDSIEHETEVSNRDEMEKIISTLGFTLYSDLTKTRQKAKFNDIEICIDEVQDLGTFIEVEKLTDQDADGLVIEVELWKVLESFGINKSDQVHEGYDVMHRAIHKLARKS